MSLALALGRRGLGRTWPNPSVGCVIVKDSLVVGRGRTGDGGRPHAEVAALAEAGVLAKGATAYVTLEPCSHFGTTPPCTDALIKSGVVRVVCAVKDKNPKVSGSGFANLKAAGIKVTTGIGIDEALDDHRGFFTRITINRPFLTLKLASSLDGRIATASGKSKWITDVDARKMVHLMRAQHDAVIVGGSTARQDNPSLTVRGLGIDHKTVRIVVCRKLDLSTSSALTRNLRDYPLWLCHGPDAPEARIAEWSALGARLIQCKLKGKLIDIADVMSRLGALGITRLFCEGGKNLATSLLRADCIDEFVTFNAGLLIGDDGYPGIGALGVKNLNESTRFEVLETQKIGPDVLHRWRKRTNEIHS